MLMIFCVPKQCGLNQVKANTLFFFTWDFFSSGK